MLGVFLSSLLIILLIQHGGGGEVVVVESLHRFHVPIETVTSSSSSTEVHTQRVTKPPTTPSVCRPSVHHENITTIHRYPNTVNLRIIVLTYNRPDSLSKTLQSLQDLELDGHSGSVEIWVDRGTSGKVHQETLDMAVGFCWRHGPVTVHIHRTNQALVGESLIISLLLV